MKAYSIQYWTGRGDLTERVGIGRTWIIAESADEAFDKALKEIPGISRLTVLFNVPYEKFPHMKARARTLLREVVIYEYGDTDKGFIAGDDYEINSISTFLSWSANKGADIVAY